MEDKKTFELICEEFTFLIRKKDVKFFNGYGVVKVEIDRENKLIGVVDKDYKIVLPLTPERVVGKLFIAPNGNFIFTGNTSDYGPRVFHVSETGYEVDLGAFDFLQLDDEVIQLYYRDYSTLYDTQSGEFLTPFYHYIGPFVYSEKYGYNVARASFYVEDENKKIINEVSTIINARGIVLENYFDLALGKELECKDATEVLNLVRKVSNKSDC